MVRGMAEISEALRAGEEAEALRAAAKLVGDLEALAPSVVASVVAVDPGSTGDRRWDALVAGIVERVAHCAGVRTPAWTAEPSRFLVRWWFVSEHRALHASALVDSPPELAARGVFIHASSLTSV